MTTHSFHLHVFDEEFTEVFKNRIKTRIIKKLLKNERVRRNIDVDVYVYQKYM